MLKKVQSKYLFFAIFVTNTVFTVFLDTMYGFQHITFRIVNLVTI